MTTPPKIERYVLRQGKMRPEIGGAWVRYEDAKKLIDKLRGNALHARDDDRSTVAGIDHLRKAEGNSVLIPCDNPDFDGYGCYVEVTAAWTDWNPQRFEGDNLSAALAMAISVEALRCNPARNVEPPAETP